MVLVKGKACASNELHHYCTKTTLKVLNLSFLSPSGYTSHALRIFSLWFLFRYTAAGRTCSSVHLELPRLKTIRSAMAPQHVDFHSAKPFSERNHAPSQCTFSVSERKHHSGSNAASNERNALSNHVPKPKTLSPLQQHVSFWDRDNDNLIYPYDVYTGFRDLGFSVPFAILSLLIPIFFSYPTRLGHSYLPDPQFRIYVDSIHKAKHGSDSGIYDCDGGLRNSQFDEMFDRFDGSNTGSLGVRDLFNLVAKNRVAADPAGWSFAYMEWSTTWLLLQKGGRVWKEDLRQCYDGTLFWRIREERMKGDGWRQGYGWKEFFNNPSALRS